MVVEMNDTTTDIALDVEGAPLLHALAWAYAAHAPAGAYWPAAFGVACMRTPHLGTVKQWLRDAIREADRMVCDIRLLELETGWTGPAPRQADWWETRDDDQIHLEWDTRVSLILSSTDEGRLRLVLYGQHEERERLIREALARPGQTQDRILQSWDEIISGPAKVMAEAMADDERELVARVGDERLEALAAYARVVQRMRPDLGQ